ncbi:sulfatase family protein [Arenibacter troitsensis]|uniref:N-sulfoglucosamine sulfohydrolase n=1 Tax=Arenibacter troitsensis TaxID=188872 RepID=A0A1X7IG72_9FLAO|nr:sulfatase [Arenibacter troitsensis]SMG13623.1 N-sulfoglucosamine sulfohydrolase [Arenibacter troitsensis]
MKTSVMTILILSFFSLFIFGCKSGEEINKQRPNILLIVSEDNGPDLGCYGIKEVSTPNLDNLAKEGVLFERAFVPYSVCSPSRAVIFTGLYPHQNGQIGLATHKFKMYDNIKTLPKYLNEAGYSTGIIGKLHVNPEKEIPFDFSAIPGSNFGKKDLKQYAVEAYNFINGSDKPFFLMVNYPDAHFPLQKQVEGMPKDPLDGSDLNGSLPFIGADSERLREYTANYYNSMNRLDESVGMLLKELQASGKADNTIIIYLGDHGAQFSRGKCSNYEAGLRIPLIIKNPDTKAKGIRQNELVNTIDLLPTFLDIAKVDFPKNLPGMSLLPLLKGAHMKNNRKYIFAGGNGSTSLLYYPRRSVRDDRYKLILNILHGKENPHYAFYETHVNDHFDAGTEEEEINNSSTEVIAAYKVWKNPPKYELYDLQNDPYEFNNLAEDMQYQDILGNMIVALDTWRAETNDPLADPIKFARFNKEMDSINIYLPNHSYSKNKDFKWHYPDYFIPN